MLELLGVILGVAIGGAGYVAYRKFSPDRIHTILEEDFERVLKEYGLYKQYTQKQILCSVCGTPITFDNLGVIEINEKEKKIIFISQECTNIAAETPSEELEPVLA